MRRTRNGVVLIIAVVLIGSTVPAVGFADDLGAERAEPAVEQNRLNIEFLRQPSDGQAVIVSGVRLPRGGFVVIHDETVEPRIPTSRGA